MRVIVSHGKRFGDHPREYGENFGVALIDGIDQGSSPRIRGESSGGLR